MRLWLPATLCATVLPMLMAGCGPAISVRPLYIPAERETPLVEPRIEGTWIAADVDEPNTDPVLMLNVAAADIHKPGGHYNVDIPVTEDLAWPIKTLSFDLRLVHIGERLFVDATLSSPDDLKILGLVPLHLIAQLSVDQDFLRIAVLDMGWATENLPDSLRDEPPTSESRTILTGSTAELRALVDRNADSREAFANVGYFCRPETDCNLRAMEDMLARAPNHPETLKLAVAFFSGRGQQDRAAALQQHLRELPPKK
jgi:hypothetical protein